MSKNQPMGDMPCADTVMVSDSTSSRPSLNDEKRTRGRSHSSQNGLRSGPDEEEEEDEDQRAVREEIRHEVKKIQWSGKAVGLKQRILRFTPSWFSVTMGTGIQASLLFNLPWKSIHPTFRAIAAGYLLLDIIIFIVFSFLTISRYVLYPKIFSVMLFHSSHSLFLGTIPMGYITIVTNIAVIGHEYGVGGGESVVMGASVLWWIGLVICVAIAFVVPYAMFTRHTHTADGLTAAWLLPIVGPITIAASGANIARLLSQYGYYSYALVIVVGSYVVTGIGVLLAGIIMTLYFHRLVIFHVPPKEVIISTCLPVGPCGQGGYALIELGRVTMYLFAELAARYPDNEAYQQLKLAAPGFYGGGIVAGICLWGLGVWWLFQAVVSVITNFVSYEIAFNMGAWGTTFPLGSLALLTYSIGNSFDSLFFKIVAACMGAVVFAMFWLVGIPTVRGFFKGTLFEAPCLSSLPDDYESYISKWNRREKSGRKGNDDSDTDAPSPNRSVRNRKKASRKQGGRSKKSAVGDASAELEKHDARGLKVQAKRDEREPKQMEIEDEINNQRAAQADQRKAKDTSDDSIIDEKAAEKV